MGVLNCAHTMFRRILFIVLLALPVAAWAFVKPVRVLAPQLLGATLTGATGTAIARAASAQQALTLLLAAPEFMRR